MGFSVEQQMVAPEQMVAQSGRPAPEPENMVDEPVWGLVGDFMADIMSQQIGGSVLILIVIALTIHPITKAIRHWRK